MTIPDFPCPECESDVEYYDTADDQKSGRYRCPNCGRDTVWKQAKALSGKDLFNKLKKDAEKYG